MTQSTTPARAIRSASHETAEKPQGPRTHTIRSAGDEGAAKEGGYGAGLPQDQSQSPRPFTRPSAQAGRSFVEQAARWPAQPFGAVGEAAGRTVLDSPPQTGQNLTMAVEFGNVMASRYEAACSEIVKHMQQAAQRQGQMMTDMLHARSPGDVLAAGNRYLLDGMQAFFDANARIVQASVKTADEALQRRTRQAD